MKTSDNEDGTFLIYADTEGTFLKLDGMAIEVGIDLKPGTSIDQADDLAASMRKHVSNIRIWKV